MPADVIQCPSCNAPVLPKGGSSVVSCPYCGASVILPRELRPESGVGTWSTLLFDNFVSNDNNWRAGNQPADEYFYNMNQTVTDGRYRWDGKLKRPFTISTSWLNAYTVSDFHLIANAKHIRGSKAGSSWGLIFRIQDNHNFYWFRIMDNQFVGVSVVKNSEWIELIEWARTETVKPNGVNQLEVIARGTHFDFLVNGQAVGEVDDERFSQGLAGVAIEGYIAEEELTFDFLDFTLRAP